MKQIIVTLLVCLCLCLFSCKTASRKEESLTQFKSEYPQIVDSLGFIELYNETKWLMYCYQCDDTLEAIDSSILGDSITYGMLELRFDTIRDYKDNGIEINFNFYYNDTKCDSFSPKVSIWGIVYSKKDNKVMYYVKHTDFANYTKDSCVDGRPCPSRFINPLQPEVVKYINDNKAKLNPWFYREAKKRGVLKD
jgi:hypothetical protein